ncbi:CD59 glycoprotein-like [Vipera latastei]
MKSLLVTPVITAFVLALFLHSGSALVCYNCPFANCDRNITCKGEEDTCLIVYDGPKNISQCWKYSDCDVNVISKHFSTKNFRYRCCQWNLCNDAPNVVASKIALSGVFLLTFAHILRFFVWN